MRDFSDVIREPLVIIGASALVLTSALGLFFESFGADETAEATVAPEAIPLPDPAPEPPTSSDALQFKPLANLTSPWPDDGRETLLTFVHLSDTHVGREGDHKAFEVAVEVINGMAPQPEFVIITGDLTDSFTPSQIRIFKDINGRLRAPVHLVPGNHDVMFDPTADRIQWWEREFPEFRTPYRVDYGPLALIGVDSQLWNARRSPQSSGQIAREQWGEMEKMIIEARKDGQRVMIFNHIPVMPTFYRSRISKSWETGWMEKYLALFEKHGIEAELSGHVHRDELYTRGKALFLNAPPISEKYTRQASLRLFRVTAQGLMYRQFYLREHGRHLSYQMDLHGVDQEVHGRWIEGMDKLDLAELWKFRHAGDPDSSRWFPHIDHDQLRAYLKSPFDLQPTARMNSRLKMNYTERP